MLPSSENRLAFSGAAFCLVSALAYTAVNICMRQLTALRCDPMWAVFNRELVTTLVVWPWLIYRALRGRPTLPGGRTMVRLLLVGLLIQVIGNVCNQWALGVVGLAVTVPVVFGVAIASGALLGRAWLAEKVSLRSAAAITVLLASLVLLGIGAEAVEPSIGADARASDSLWLLLGVGAAGLAGATFSPLNIVIRHSVTRTTVPSAVAFLIPLTGAVSLGPLSIWRLGTEPWWNTPWQQFGLMSAAGVFNLIAFLALIHGLQRTTIVHANMISASQVAMAALAGMLLFCEPPNPWLLAGIGLTMAGILAIDRPAESADV